MLARRALVLAACVWLSVGAAGVHAAPADALRDQFVALSDALRNSPFQRPLHLVSIETDDTLKGEIHAVLEHGFGSVRAALVEPANWCDILILHINVKHCMLEPGGQLAVRLGKKSAQPVDEAYPMLFSHRVDSARPDDLEIRLEAPEGPMSTRDYRIRLRAIPIDRGRTFIHLVYSTQVGLAGRIAMTTFLNTVASGKVGFTVVGRDGDGRPEYIGGARGMIERNTLRYYLAIEAYLDALSAPPTSRMERSLAAWFDATERHARQLHEMDRADYLEMKRAEYWRQRRLGWKPRS